MRVWIVQTGEEMPSDGDDTRLLRAALLANELAKRGHVVVFWNSTFNHQKKVQRFERTTRLRQNDLYDSVFLYGRPYAKNIGFTRILSQRDNAREFIRAARSEPPPDLIHCGFPPIELISNAVRYAKGLGIPSTIDCRDMWPDVINDRLSPVARLSAAPLLLSWRNSKRNALRSATAITGVSDAFVAWGAAGAGRKPGHLDKAFHLATAPEPISAEALASGRRYWRDKIGQISSGALIICFAGTFSRRLDLPTVLDGADLLDASERRRVRIIFCGNGDLRGEIEKRAEVNSALLYGGWCNRPQLISLMELSSVGLLPYPNTPDFLASYPNKVGEYLMAGLPIMTGLRGSVADLLSPNGLRIGYQVGNATSFAAAVRTLLTRTDLRRSRDVAGEVGARYFNPERIYPQFADWLEMIARTRRPVP